MDDEDRPDKSPSAAEVPTPATAESDRSKRLLSRDALPVIEVPRSAPHQIREFRLPAGLSGPIARPAPTREPGPAASEAAGAPDRAQPTDAEASGEGRGKAEEKKERAKAEKKERAKAEEKKERAKADEKKERTEVAGTERTEPGGKKKRADSTARFGDRTLEWLREGDELADEERAGASPDDEGEPTATDAGRRSYGALWIGLVIAIAAAAALVLWQLSS